MRQKATEGVVWWRSGTSPPTPSAKGRAVAVTSRLVYREWDDNGTRRRHHIVGRVQFGGKPDDPQPTDHDTEKAVAV